MDGEVVFNLRVKDQMTPAVTRAAGAQGTYAAATRDAASANNDCYIKMTAQLVAIQTLYRSTGMLAGNMHELGIISDGTAARLQKVQAGVGLVVGAYSAMKSVILITRALTSAEIGLSLVKTYQKVLANPAAVGLVIGAAATTAAVGGYLYGKHQAGGGGDTNVTQHISTGGAQVPETVKRAQSRAMLEAAGGS